MTTPNTPASAGKSDFCDAIGTLYAYFQQTPEVMADSTRELAALEAIERDRAEWDAAPSNNRELWQQIGAQERDALRKQLAEREAELASVKHLAAAEKQRMDDVLDQEQEALAKCKAKLAEQSAALASAKEALQKARGYVYDRDPYEGDCIDNEDTKAVNNALAQIEALAGGSTFSASLPSS